MMDFDYVVMPALILVIALLLVWLCIRRMRTLFAKTYSRWRRIAECGGLSICLLLAAVAGGSCSFNAIKLYYVRATNPPLGNLYKVDGRTMHLNCTGSGSPTIVLEAGSGGDGLVWGGIQPALSRTTRVCSYDRAGLGWSEPRPGPRDADHIAHELHELLLQAKIDGQFVLMGHSVAGLYMRDYIKHYPSEVAGIVFVDSSTPSVSTQNGLGRSLLMTKISRPIFILGIPRLVGVCSKPKPGFDAHTGVLQREDVCHTEYGPVLRELEGRNRSDQQTIGTGPYGALPILILSHDPAQRQRANQLGSGWNQDQENLKSLSTQSRRIIAKGSGHYVMFDRPELIEKEVPAFIEQIRGKASPSSAYGSTIEE
jgi:pimeloyl-ACP methyl ester carboxylesterase